MPSYIIALLTVACRGFDFRRSHGSASWCWAGWRHHASASSHNILNSHFSSQPKDFVSLSAVHKHYCTSREALQCNGPKFKPYHVNLTMMRPGNGEIQLQNDSPLAKIAIATDGRMAEIWYLYPAESLEALPRDLRTPKPLRATVGTSMMGLGLDDIHLWNNSLFVVLGKILWLPAKYDASTQLNITKHYCANVKHRNLCKLLWVRQWCGLASVKSNCETRVFTAEM